MSSSRLKKLLRQRSVDVEGERKFTEVGKTLEGDSIIHLSKSGATDKPVRTADPRTSRTKQRNVVNGKTRNLGGLIGLWKEKEEKETPVITRLQQSKEPSLDKSTVKERKISVEKKTAVQRKTSILRKDPATVEQTPSKEKLQAPQNEVKDTNKKVPLNEVKDTNKKARKTSRQALGDFTASFTRSADNKKNAQKEETRPAASKNSIKEEVKPTEGKKSLKEDAKQTDSKKTLKDDAKFSDSKNSVKEDAKQTDSKKLKDDAKFGDSKKIKDEGKLVDRKKKEDAARLDRTSPFQKDGKVNANFLSNINTTKTRAQTGKPGTLTKSKTFDNSSSPFQKDGKLNANFLLKKETPTIQTPKIQTPEVQSPKFQSPKTLEDPGKQTTLTKVKSFDEAGKSVSKTLLQLSKYESLSTSSPDVSEGSTTSALRKDSVKRHSFRRRTKLDSDAKNLASDFEQIFNRLSQGHSAISDNDITSILAQVSQNEKAVALTTTHTSAKTEGDNVDEEKISIDKIENEKSKVDVPNIIVTGDTVSEKRVLKDSTNSKNKKTNIKTRASSFEEKTQKEGNVPGTGTKDVINLPSIVPGKKAGESPQKNDSNQSVPKTATQAKLEEIAARREVLRKKYLERTHTESSIALEKKERFKRQGFNEGELETTKDETKPTEVAEKSATLSPKTKTLDKAQEKNFKSLLEKKLSKGPPSEGEKRLSAENVLSQIVNRTETLSASSSGDEQKKKRLLTKGGSETPPVMRKRQGDVKNILRRLSLNIPPPTPEEIVEEMQGQELTEEERMQKNLDKRRRALRKFKQDTSTDDKSDVENKKESVRATKMDNKRSNNKAPLSERKFSPVRNQSLSRSSSADSATNEPTRTVAETAASLLARRDSKEKNQPTKTSVEKKVPTVLQGKVSEVQKTFNPLVRRRHSLCDRFPPDMPNLGDDKPSPRRDRPLDPNHPSRKSFQKNTEWLAKMVDEAVSNEKHMSPKPKEKTEEKPRISLKSIKQNVEVEPICLPERKTWLEQVAKRNTFNSMTPKQRLMKTKSLCNLSSLDDYEDEDMRMLLDSDRSLSRQVSVETIGKSIDVEIRGNAYELPSAIKRRSMNLDVLEQTDISNINGEHGNISSEKDVELDESVQDAMETIDIPTLQDRMLRFQQTNNNDSSVRYRKPKSRAINRKQRPKSYAGEFLSEMVFENGSFRYKNEESKQNIANLGKVLMADNNAPVDGNNNSSNNNDNHDNNNSNDSNSSNTLSVSNRRTNRRSLLMNHRILAEIAEMESRENEIMEERAKATSELERKNTNLNRRASVPVMDFGTTESAEGKGNNKLKSKAFKQFLNENEVRTST